MQIIPEASGENQSEDQGQNPPNEGGNSTEGGATERPDWVPEEAWNAETGVADLAKLGEAWNAKGIDTDLPAEDAQYAPPELEGFSAEEIQSDISFKLLEGVARKAGIGQARFQEFAKEWLEGVEAHATEQMKATKEALGANADSRLQSIANGLAGKLSADEAAAVRASFTDPLAIQAIEKLLKGTTSAAPRSPAPQQAQRKSEEEIRALQADPRYYDPKKRDPAVVKEVDEWFAAQYAEKK